MAETQHRVEESLQAECLTERAGVVAEQSIADRAYRQIMGSFPTGVCIVTTRDVDGEPLGFTANAVASVSRFPPILLVCASQGMFTLSAIRRSGVFAVNILGDGSETLARHFAARAPNKFNGAQTSDGQLGVPIFASAIAHVECRVQLLSEVGDHVVVFGHALGGSAKSKASPMLYYRSRFHNWTAEGPE